VIHIIGKGNGEVEVFDDESPPKVAPVVSEADFWDGLVGDDDLKPAHSNAAPPGVE
jgi:hypothetical protein